MLESLDISKSSKIPDKQTADHISLIRKLVGHQSLMIQGDGQNISHHRPESRIAKMPDRVPRLSDIDTRLIYHSLLSAINLSNGIPMQPRESPTTAFKAIVGKGNNENVVIEALRRRPWINVTVSSTTNLEAYDGKFGDYNLVWSQMLVQNFTCIIVTGKKNNQIRDTCAYNKNQFLAFVKKTEGYCLPQLRTFLESETGMVIFDQFKKITTKETLLYAMRAFQHHKKSYTNPPQDTPQPSKYPLSTDTETAIRHTKARSTSYIKTAAYRGTPTSVSWQRLRLHNHLPGLEELCDKMPLYYNMRDYLDSSTDIVNCVFDVMPYTAVIHGLVDQQLVEFQRMFVLIEAANYYESNKKDENAVRLVREKYPILGLGIDDVPVLPHAKLKGIMACNNLWILKPGQNSNRGRGIVVSMSLSDIIAYVKRSDVPVVVQKYIENPMLYHGRKFDIRMYALATWVQGCLKLYFYQDGYVRTASFDYSINATDTRIHLTNEAVQIQNEEFGMFEVGNKLTLAQLNDYIREKNPEYDFYKIHFPLMKVCVFSKRRNLWSKRSRLYPPS